VLWILSPTRLDFKCRLSRPSATSTNKSLVALAVVVNSTSALEKPNTLLIESLENDPVLKFKVVLLGLVPEAIKNDDLLVFTS